MEKTLGQKDMDLVELELYLTLCQMVLANMPKKQCSKFIILISYFF